MGHDTYANHWPVAQDMKWAAHSASEKRNQTSSWLAHSAPSSLPKWSRDDNEKSSWRESSASTMSSLSSLWRRYWPLGDRPIFQQRSRPLTAPTPDPSMLRFCLLCSLWYATSALSSNTGKAILTQFRYPVTLTFVQFGFVAGYCLLFASPVVRFTRLRKPTRAILRDTIPMGLFQVGGHMFSSMAISRIPVSTVHTIKALSPLFTVAAYALLFGVSYSAKTYISLLPLTVGVMLACSFDMSASDVLGLLSAFGSALVFVSSNIFFKKIMPSSSKATGAQQGSAHKLDKLNLLFYSSGMAFLLMFPIWLYVDMPALLSATRSAYVVHPSHGHAAPHSVTYYFIMNGTVHFAQNIIAFVILASTSPVTYSIASLVKRVAVICIAIVWFAQAVHPVQGLGICMTFAGLWMYNQAKADVERGENKMRRVEAARDLVLPSTKFEFASPAISPSREIPDPFLQQHSTSTATARPVYATATPPTYAVRAPPPPPPPSSRHAPHPNLKIIPPKSFPQSNTNTQNVIVSPVDSYPSPPASHDSPPSSAVASIHHHTGAAHAVNRARRGTVSADTRDAALVYAAA